MPVSLVCPFYEKTLVVLAVSSEPVSVCFSLLRAKNSEFSVIFAPQENFHLKSCRSFKYLAENSLLGATGK